MKELTFLIVDDSTSFRQILSELVEKHPHWSVMAEAGDGEEAVCLAARYLPDVLLMDVNMPVMNGVEATRRIKHFAPQVRVIAFSGYPDDEFRQASLRAGADFHLPKEDLDVGTLGRLIAVLFPLTQDEP